MAKMQLTSVKVPEDLFEEFKISCVKHKFSIQKLTERCMYMYLTDNEFKQLSTKKVSAIRFTNGSTYESLTYSLEDAEKDYFIRVYTNYKIVEIDCSK
jgi:hypothetical protein